MSSPTARRLARLIFILPLLAALPVAGQTLNEDFKLTASDGASDDDFGRCVAISGTTTIIGAKNDDDAGTRSGSAYLFDTTTGLQLFKLTASDAEEFDGFGNSVAVSGTTAIVGAAFSDDAGSFSGSAYIFDTITGQQLIKLTASDAAANDQFGTSVAISGTTAILGAEGDDEGRGSAYLFDTTTGQQLFKLTASDGAPGDRFGGSVAFSGSIAIIGARNDEDAGFRSGSAYLFDTTTGQQLFKLTAADAAAEDQFGSTLAISGTTAIVGSPNDSLAGYFYAGSAYLFDTTTGAQFAKLSAPEAADYDYFGGSVAVSGTTAIIGSIGDADAGSSSGSAYLIDITAGQQIFKLTASDAEASDRLGTFVAISGTTAIAGTPDDTDANIRSGSAYIFSGSPRIVRQPQGDVVQAGDPVSFDFILANPSGVNYQWRRDGVNLSDGGNITGATTPTLSIVASESDEASYECLVTGIWGPPSTSDRVVLGVLADPNACTADLNGDGVYDFFDVSVFLSAYGAGCP